MPEFTQEQRRIIARLDRAFKDAARAGLALRVFDSSVLMLRVEALDDPRYDQFGSAAKLWAEEHTEQIAIGLNADGGAGC